MIGIIKVCLNSNMLLRTRIGPTAMGDIVDAVADRFDIRLPCTSAARWRIVLLEIGRHFGGNAGVILPPGSSTKERLRLCYWRVQADSAF